MKINEELLRSVFLIQNPSNNRWCNDQAMNTITSLAPAGCTVIRNRGNLLIRKGPNSGPHPFYLAHMDQVHDYQPGMSLHISKDRVLTAYDGNRQRCGVGGDDKCGVYLALQMLHSLPHVTAVFVRDEEVGCQGSAEVPLSWFLNAAFVIQSDRNNRTFDVIRDTNGMNCASDEFMDTILSMSAAVEAGHRENSGTVTDIGELACRGLAVSMVNISSGYHHYHSKTEYVELDQLEISCQLALEAGERMGSVRWEHTPESAYGNWFRGRGGYGGWGLDDIYDEDDRRYGQLARTVKTARLGAIDDDDDEDDIPFIDDELLDGREAEYDPAVHALEATPEREYLIGELEEYGYEREYHQLDRVSTETLAQLLQKLMDEDSETLEESNAG